MDIVDRFTILVVDEEPPICDILTRIAQKAFPQAQFVNTRSVAETYHYLDQQVTELPQLILLDIDLKEAKNGLDMLPELNHRLQGRVPIIMLSVQTERLKV
ncbi:response regulator [Spirosoma sp. KNUC1025]|uniref:response regulator n=1 Tax=Spirosoma sp. KNUC1025 TaxID=2894082 RepID=UPI001E40896E|nr:response regulator [Spirosoma sp. KNUC1025]UFH57750.1 response regulator [Spirosoma sp. KNUC1025]